MTIINIPGGTMHTDKKMTTLDEALARQSAEETTRIAKALDFSEIHEAIDELLAQCRRAPSNPDRDNEAILQAARAAGFPNARMVEPMTPERDDWHDLKRTEEDARF